MIIARSKYICFLLLALGLLIAPLHANQFIPETPATTKQSKSAYHTLYNYVEHLVIGAMGGFMISAYLAENRRWQPHQIRNLGMYCIYLTSFFALGRLLGYDK